MKDIERRVGALEAKAPKPPKPDMSEFERAFEDVLGCTLAELECDDLDRVFQLIETAPGFAHPILLRACLARPEDREPERPPLQKNYLVAPGKWKHPAVDTPVSRAHRLWTRRRWGYETAADDLEAHPLGRELEAWAASTDRPYRNGADLRLLLRRIGVLPWGVMSYFELRRLVDLCAALDELAAELPDLEVPAEVFWIVLGWGKGDIRRWSAA